MINPENDLNPEEIYLSFIESSINLRLRDHRESQKFSAYLQIKRLLDAKNFLLAFTRRASDDIKTLEDELQLLSSQMPNNKERMEVLREDIDLRSSLLKKYHPYFLSIINQLIDAEEEKSILTNQLQ